MKKAVLFMLLFCSMYSFSQNANLKTGAFKNYDDYTDNDVSKQESLELKPFIRVNTVDKKYSDTLYRLEAVSKIPFAIYDGKKLYIRTEDTLYRKMDHIGRYPFVTITTKVHLEGRWVTVNKTPIFEEEHDEVQRYTWFIDRDGKWARTGFESIRQLLKGNHDLIVDYDKEKWNNEIFMKYLLKMNERYPIK
jgi:hypothetical protein